MAGNVAWQVKATNVPEKYAKCVDAQVDQNRNTSTTRLQSCISRAEPSLKPAKHHDSQEDMA